MIDMEEIYGKQGIDTPYEREKVDYHPQLSYPEKEKYSRITPQVIQQIERSKDFTISQTLMDYDLLIEEIQNFLGVIDSRNSSDDFKTYKQDLISNKLPQIIEDENKLCGYDGSGDVEMYTILSRMKDSCVSRRDFIDRHFRIQLTNETDMQLIQDQEEQSIQNWLTAENDFIGLTDQIKQSYQNYESDGSNPDVAYLEQALVNQETAKNTQASLHTTLADTAYIHRNRTGIFFDLVNQFKMIIYDPHVVMPADLKSFLLKMATLPDLSSAKAHLILSFREWKDQHNAMKGQYMMMDDHKEDYISQQQWFHQQVETKSNPPLKNWLYNQQDNNEAFNVFAEIMVNSIQSSQKKYESSLVDMAKFYQQEGVFYERQLLFIQKKEQIRQFLSILKDLEETKEITEKWADEYLTAKGYSVL
jgi:hypothetical protein